MFNIGKTIIRWIPTFYTNIKSCVFVNGKPSSWFNVQRCCRQGDPLSPYIFVICAEILAILIRQNDKIRGISIDGK